MLLVRYNILYLGDCKRIWEILLENNFYFNEVFKIVATGCRYTDVKQFFFVWGRETSIKVILEFQY
jgi:hypothetical protein